MYDTWKMPQLKAELKSRGLKLSGRKADLVKRLVYSDENSNFGHSVCETVEPAMSLPSPREYKDITGNSLLPRITATHIQTLAERFQKKTEAASRMYEAGCVLYVRTAKVDEDYFIKAEIKAEMKKVTYCINLKINEHGEVMEQSCECPVGSGLIADCKHVFAVLFAVEQMNREKKMILHLSCTQKLQTFHQPKVQFIGSPLKAPMLSTRRHQVFCAVPDKYLKVENYNDYVKNLLINYGKVSTCPLKQLIAPANPYGVMWDHDTYTVSTLEERLLMSLKLQNIIPEDIIDIERRTRDQSEAEEWRFQRSIRLTSSNFRRICHAKPETLPRLPEQLMDQTPVRSIMLGHGKNNEKAAIRKYEEWTDNVIKVQPCGLFVSPTHPFLALSPDGIINEDVLLDVKCPWTARKLKISPTTVPWLEYGEDGSLKLIEDTPYYNQIQGQFFATGKKFCNLVIYTFKDLKVVDVPRNNPFIEKMVSKLSVFWDSYFKPKLVERFLIRDYHKIKCDHHK